MVLKYKKNVGFEEVIKQFKKENKIQFQNRYALKILKKANKKFPGWVEATLDTNEIRKILLPFHFHWKKMLVPFRGATVNETVTRLKKDRNYQNICGDCHKTIVKYNKRRKKTLFLGEGPVRGIWEYWFMKHNEEIVSLDGLHTMISIFYPKKSKNSKYKCYVATSNGKKD